MKDWHKPFLTYISKGAVTERLKNVTNTRYLFTCGSFPKYTQVRFINSNTAFPACQMQNMFLLNEKTKQTINSNNQAKTILHISK